MFFTVQQLIDLSDVGHIGRRRASKLKVTPHVTQKAKGSATDGGSLRHPGYASRQKIRQRIEEGVG